MLKLYRRQQGRVTEYHEAWVHSDGVIEHWGTLGEEGHTREHNLDTNISEEENIVQILAPVMSNGFEPIDLDDHAILLIEYEIEGMFGKDDMSDLEKRYDLQERMDQTLGWTGLGHCDGGSIGSGTMEVCCFVVDFEIAKRVIEKDLAGTEFADYSRIYDERASSV